MPRGGLAFYNCGPVSGASQPHKHVQVVPLPLDDSGGPQGGAGSSGARSRQRPPIWPAVAEATAGVPAGQSVELRSLPFAAFAAALVPPAEEAAVGPYLEGVYRQLLDRCCTFMEQQTGQAGATPADGSLSYNWGAPKGRAWMRGAAAESARPRNNTESHTHTSGPLYPLAVCTDDFMLVVPRRQESVGPVRCAAQRRHRASATVGPRAAAPQLLLTCSPALCPAAAATRWRLQAASLCAALRSSSTCGSRARCTCWRSLATPGDAAFEMRPPRPTLHGGGSAYRRQIAAVRVWGQRDVARL